MHRRILLLSLVVAACGGGQPTAGPVPTPPPTGALVWNVGQINLVVGGPAFDLRSTLPAGAVAGGVFSVDGSGAQLPGWITLTAAGLLSAAPAAPATTLNNVIFGYTTP